MKKIIALIIVLSMLLTSFVVSAAEEIVIVDDENIIMKVKEISTNPKDMYMKVYLENKTNTPIMFSLVDSVVNGYESDPFWAKEVNAGKKANDTIKWYNVEDDGITGEISSIIVSFRAYNSDDWMAPDFYNDSISIYPLGKENAVITERTALDTDEIIVDNNDISIIITGYGEDSIWGYTANAYLVNKTNKTMMFSVKDAAVNGFECDPFWATELPANSRKYSSLSWSKNSFEENDIDQVEEIEICFRVYDSNDWMAPDLYEDTVILKP